MCVSRDTHLAEPQYWLKVSQLFGSEMYHVLLHGQVLWFFFFFFVEGEINYVLQVHKKIESMVPVFMYFFFWSSKSPVSSLLTVMGQNPVNFDEPCVDSCYNIVNILLMYIACDAWQKHFISEPPKCTKFINLFAFGTILSLAVALEKCFRLTMPTCLPAFCTSTKNSCILVSHFIIGFYSNSFRIALFNEHSTKVYSYTSVLWMWQDWRLCFTSVQTSASFVKTEVLILFASVSAVDTLWRMALLGAGNIDCCT